MKFLQGLLLVAGIWLAGECALTVHYARQRSVYTFDQLNKVLRESSQTMDEVRKGATTWNQASKDQSEYATRALGSVQETTASIRTLVKRTDASLNDLVLPNLAASVKEQNQALLKSQKQLQDSLLEVSKATSQAEKIFQDADEQINNPAIKESVDSLAEAAQNTASATNEAAASMKTIHAGLEYELKQLEAPVTKVKAALNISLLVIRRLFF